MPQKRRVLEQLLPRRTLRRRELAFFLAAQDVLAFAFREVRMVGGRLVEEHPQRDPDQRHAARDDERRLPVELQDAEHDERRREHRADRGSRVQPAGRDRALLGREPLRDGLHARREDRRLAHAKQAAEERERAPAGREAVQHVRRRPGEREDREADLEADDVEDVAGHRLHHRVGALECRDHVRVLLRGHVQLVGEGRRRDREGTAREIVEDGPEHDQPDDPPPQSLDLVCQHGVVSPSRCVSRRAAWGCRAGRLMNSVRRSGRWAGPGFLSMYRCGRCFGEI